ncbi:MAG: MFS transporter [Planctomycetota bacterium]
MSTQTPAARPPGVVEVVFLAVTASLMLVPVTLPVPVLKGLVQERFGVSDLATSLFMSLNMVGALMAAPLAGLTADRFGRHRPLIAVALLADAACMWGLTWDLPFAAFLALRFLEGGAHIFALSLLLSLAAARAEGVGRGGVMGAVGGGMTLGVAVGAPLGGQLGRDDALAPLVAGAVMLVVLALVTAVGLRDARGRGRRQHRLRDLVGAAKRESALLLPLAYAFADRFTVGFFIASFPLYMKRVYALPPPEIGMLLGLMLGPFSLLSFAFGRISDRSSRIALVVVGSAAYGAGLVSLGVWTPAELRIVMPVLGVLSAVMFVPSLLMITDLAPKEIRATALGAFNAVGSLGLLVGPLVAGAVSERVAASTDWPTGYTAAFAVAGAAELACVVLTMRGLLRLRRDGRLT